MAWVDGYQIAKPVEDTVEELKKIDGYLNDEDARAYLGKLLIENLGFFWHMISGEKMAEWQEIVLNGWFKKDYSATVAFRAAGKSYLISIFCFLYCIINKNSTVVLVAANFRQIKEIFQKIETFLKHPKAALLRATIEETKNNVYSRSPDLLQLNFKNGSKVKGLPMSGENLRGQRASVLIIDEGLLLSEVVYDRVLKPFLNARLNANEEEKVKEREDELIALGALKEEDRTIFPPNKIIITSSASYTFEYLYTGLWEPYIKAITDPNRERDRKTPSYFAMRISYKALKGIWYIDAAQFAALEAEGKSETDTSKRENEALFTDASESYFNVKKLHECTAPDGDPLTVEIKGQREAEYILAIDPAYGDNKNNDFFAMGVYMLLKEERRIVQVHTYGRAGSDLQNQYKYLAYLLKNFNIIWVSIDASGTEFIDSFNESELAKQQNLKLSYIITDLDDENYPKAVSDAKYEWNIQERRIVYPQKFKSSVIRSMNEYLQGGIAAKKVWFGSKLAMNDNKMRAALALTLPFEPKDKEGMPQSNLEFIEEQDDWILQTKRQLGMIQVKSTSLGTLQYDLPSTERNSTSANKARKDNYTCLLIAYYSSKHIFELLFAPENNNTSYTPILF